MSAECESKSQLKIHMRSTPAVKYRVKSTATKNPFEPPYVCELTSPVAC